MKPIHWLLLGCLTLAGCDQPAPPHGAPDVLATVGSRPIRVADLEAEAARRAALGQAVPAKESLLEELITREAMLVRALELGLAEDPDVRRRYHNLLLAELKERELKPRLAEAKVAPEALRAATARATERQPAQIRLAALRYSVSPRTSPEKHAQFAERLAVARAKVSRLPREEAGFGALAVDYSDDQTTRYRGGDLGWFDVGGTNYALPKQVLAAGHGLVRVGEISEVLQTDQGYFLIRLMERQEAGRPPSGASQAAQDQKLLAQERRRIEIEFSAETRTRTQVHIDTQAVAAAHLDRAQPATRAASLVPSIAPETDTQP